MARYREISVYVDEDQIELLRQAAAIQGLPMSSWARSILLERAREVLGTRILRPGESFQDADATLDVATGEIHRGER